MDHAEFCHLHVHNQYCLSGDSIIYNCRTHHIKGKAYRKDYTNLKQSKTLKYLFDNFKKTRGSTFKYLVKVFDGEKFVSSKIKNIKHSGKKNLFKLTTESGKTICASKNHLFLTKDGWKKIKNLSVGDMMGCNGEPLYNNKNWLEMKYFKEGLNQLQISQICNVSRDLIKQKIKKFKLHKTKSEWMQWHTVNPKTIEKIKLIKFKNRGNLPKLKTLSNSRNRINRWFKYLKVECSNCRETKSRLEIHHIDKNPFNNEELNLRVLCKSCHSREHTEIPFTIRYEKLILIEKDKRKDTYDIEIYHPSHNFVANGLITHNSLLDGVGSSEKYAKRAKKMGFEYLSLTNHGNIDGLIKHQKACEEEEIIPLFGCEMYIVPDLVLKNKDEKSGHITILIKNQTGWIELCRLLTIANLEGFYRRPRIDYKTFLASNLSGFVALTGCSGSFLNRKFGEGFFWNLVEEMKKDLYLEIMPHAMPEQISHNKKCKELSVKYGIPLVGTNDAHYILPDEDIVQEVLLAIQTHAKWKDKNRWKFQIKGLHLRSSEEMIVAFKKQNVFNDLEYGKALRNTIVIAEKCKDFRIERQRVSLPKIKREKKYEGVDSTELLFILCHKEKLKLQEWNSEYQKRLNYELDIIQKKKFERYFLIVWDLVKWCRKNNILIGSGRGSVGGSLVAYLLKITCVDPLKYNLLFSRFISEERIDLPDIDIDFEDRKREQVRQYLKDSYGGNNVSGVSTFSQMKGRAAARDVARVFEIPLKEVDTFAKVIEYGENESAIRQAIKVTQEGDDFESKYPDETKIMLKLEGTVRNSGQHAAAVIVSSENLKSGTKGNLCRRGKDVIVSNWDMEDAEYMGLMKLDILGLSTLSILSETAKLILENHKKEIIFEQIPIGNKKVLEMLSNGETTGIFQLATPLSTDICRQVEIDTFEDIVSVLALARPGSLHSGMTKNFIDRKHGRKWEKKHPIYEQITKNTYGVILFQEQVMEVFHKVAGLPYDVADNIRKIIGKKRDVKEFEKYKEQFTRGCLKLKTFNAREIEWFWNMLLKCANYLFCKSHAVEYGILAYWTAWSKYFYPIEFICANLSCGAEDKKFELIEVAKKSGIKIIPPKIGLSDSLEWKTGDKCLYVPFIEIKGFGESAAQKCLTKIKNRQLSFFNLFAEKENEIQGKTKIDRILNEIKAFDKDIIPKNINRYFSFEINESKKQDIEVVERRWNGYGETFNLKNCRQCQLIKECQQPVYASPGKYNIMIIGEAPGFEEDQQGRGFVGRGGKMIWEELAKYNLERKMFHVSNVCKCYPAKSKTPNEKQIKSCFNSWLKREIDSLKCNFILAFGNTGLKAFSSKGSGITRMNSKLEWSDKAQAWVCYVVHPAGVLRGGIDREVFNKGIKVFAKKVKEVI